MLLLLAVLYNFYLGANFMGSHNTWILLYKEWLVVSIVCIIKVDEKWTESLRRRHYIFGGEKVLCGYCYYSYWDSSGWGSQTRWNATAAFGLEVGVEDNQDGGAVLE